MTRIQLKEKIKKLPAWPGIYLFIDNKDKSLYIGKALNLKNRVSQYLKTYNTRLNKMLSETKKINFIKTGSDIEALILESQYIKEYQPRFNIVMRDDKQYFYVGFTDDIFPKIILTHQPGSRNASDFANQKSRISLPGRPPNYIGPFTDGSVLKSTLRFLRRIFPYCTCAKPHNNFCLNYHTGHCVGFCCLKARKYDKEILIDYRRNIKAIREILSGKRESLIKDLSRKMSALAKKEEFEKAINLKSKIEKLKRVFENARIIKNHELSKNYRSELQLIIKSKKPIIRIEGYDISNIQGKYATGSMVTFVNGVPDKNYYRKFNIKTVRGSNDIAMLREIIERRFSHTEWPFPDLILIDGGKGQLSAATGIIPKRIPLIALSKDEKHRGNRIYISGRKDAITLSRLPVSIKNFLLRIDSEAHRFAIGYYRKLHIRQLLN